MNRRFLLEQVIAKQEIPLLEAPIIEEQLRVEMPGSATYPMSRSDKLIIYQSKDAESYEIYVDDVLKKSVPAIKPVFNNVRIQILNKGALDVGYRVNGGEWVLAYNRNYTDNTYNNVTKVEVALPDAGGADVIDIFASNSILVQSITEPDSSTSNPLDITEYLQDGYNIEIWGDD